LWQHTVVITTQNLFTEAAAEGIVVPMYHLQYGYLVCVDTPSGLTAYLVNGFR